MAISTIPGPDRYQQQLNLAANQNLAEANKIQANSALPEEKDDPDQDLVHFSGRANLFESMASHYRVEEMNFRQVIDLRNDLYEAGMIDMKQVNGLTMATQTYPDRQAFDLEEALQKFSSDSNNFYMKPEMESLTTLVQNLKSASTPVALQQ